MTNRMAEPTDPAPKRTTKGEGAPHLRLVGDSRSSDARGSDARGSDSADTHASAEPVDLSPALEDVVRRFGGYMRRTAHRHSIDAAELEDVVQETRIRLWKALGSDEKIRHAPASYIARTVMSAAVDFLRRRRARREEALPEPQQIGSLSFASADTADRTVAEADVSAALDRAVNLLVESRRPVIRMYLAGYDREEIAELLEWSEAKTRNLLYRGLADLRETLNEWGYGPGATS